MWLEDSKAGLVIHQIMLPAHDIELYESLAKENHCDVKYQGDAYALEIEVTIKTALPHRFHIEFVNLLYRQAIRNKIKDTIKQSY